MFKEALVSALDQRRQWACNDCRTYLFAKSQTGWRDHQDWLGGGNMAKPLILFAFWDVLAGVYAHHLPAEEGLIWSESDMAAVSEFSEPIKDQIEVAKTSNSAVGKLYLSVPRIGDIVQVGKVLEKFLKEFSSSVHLGVKPSYFARKIRPDYRNALAHMYSPRLNGGTYSTEPTPAYFDHLMHWIANYPDPVVVDDEGTKKINGCAMLRDSERLANALIQNVMNVFTEDESQAGLAWLGLIDRSVEESSASNSDQSPSPAETVNPAPPSVDTASE